MSAIAEAQERTAARIEIRGTVQGVGFRPFVCRLAREMGFCGFVRNTPRGVEICLEGNTEPQIFIDRLRREAPPNSRIHRISIEPLKPNGYASFEIIAASVGEATVFAPPDLFTCERCLAELFSPGDRRYLYPFINCTDCGPRYSIIRALPYERERTTMASFSMCRSCEEEYRDPVSRRFHAEPNACPACGPQIFFASEGRKEPASVSAAADRIRAGKIVALKGIGGFHLVCDPRNGATVRRLRELKKRETKPLALMAKDIGTVRRIAFVDEDEERILRSASRPIVLLRKKAEIEGISPGLSTLGVMLPYTPLHALLMEEIPLVVATSANLRESPILRAEEEGIGELCDCVLTHDREIAMRCDDSVLRVVCGKTVFSRRARGYVPEPLERLPGRAPQIVALGGELKNTVTVAKDGYLITSQYLGDMKDLRNRQYLEEVISHYLRLYSVEPDLVCCDLHPDFTTTSMAERWGKPVVSVQHHIAHVFAILAEHALDPSEPFVGVAFDGTGYGEDGCVWGGEVFVGDRQGVRREFHLKYLPQQGGDLAVREPWRMALAYVLDAVGEVRRVGTLSLVEERKLWGAERAIRNKAYCPMTSSVGRLFDAVSAIVGVAPLRVDYEAEAAMRLEAVACEDVSDSYPFDIAGPVIDMRRAIAAILEDRDPPPVVSARFHNTVAQAIVSAARTCAAGYGTKRVLLGGGVFLNAFLLERTLRGLEEAGLEVFSSERFSPGDEAISLGQAYFAALRA